MKKDLLIGVLNDYLDMISNLVQRNGNNQDSFEYSKILKFNVE